jgi:putative SOS response-associated peptidase YedK
MCINFQPAANPAFLAERLGPMAPPLRLAQFGLVPHWCQDAAQARELSRKTYNARSETAASKPSFRHAWSSAQWVLVPMDCFFEPSWEDAAANAGRPTRWRIAQADGQPFAVAGLWDRWTDPATGASSGSFTVLTVNADGHAVMGRMHRPDEEKRMPVIVASERYAEWLSASPQHAASLMQAAPAEILCAAPAPITTTSEPVTKTLSLF